LAKIVDRFCGWIVKQEWHHGALAHEVALAEEELRCRTKLTTKRKLCGPPTLDF
jgi:hypothetical protein